MARKTPLQPVFDHRPRRGGTNVSGTPGTIRHDRITPSGPTVTATPGTFTVARSITPTGPTVAATPGTPSLGLAVSPTGPSVGVTPGSTTVAT